MQTTNISYITMDKLRKQCLASLCAYIDAKQIKHNNKLEYAKKMACTAAKVDDFNKIVPAQLRGITAYFNKEIKAYEESRKVAMQKENEKLILAELFRYTIFAEA